MRIFLVAALTLAGAAACQYSPAPTGTPQSLNAAAQPSDVPNANAPRGDAYFETYIGRNELGPDR